MKTDFTIIADGGITAPQGFKAGAAQAAVKKAGRYDLAVVASEVSAIAAGVFTTNKFQAAPVLVSRRHLQQESAWGFVVNSGCANACTGEPGLQDAVKMAQDTAQGLGCKPEAILVASTGVIGVPLPLERVTAGIAAACGNLSREHGELAAQAILTTDTFKKELAVKYEEEGKTVTLGAMAKGSGMIHPDMATMLGFVTTDAAITKDCLQQALCEANSYSFNMITVDRDTSTNDSLFILANGQAGNPVIDSAESAAYGRFLDALTYLCTELAKLIAKDGEGATKLIEVRVQGAKTLQDARLAARSIAASNLVKAAIFGADANWGRIVCALGYSGADFDPALADVYIGDLAMAQNGQGLNFDEEKAARLLKEDAVVLKVVLKQGPADATAWGCDLTYDYVKINGDYRT
ncbi:MAG: bifunctional glutamate N-acetyltransferase/amino-acid acetyltransferase ArgJ [Clostridia bacterium]|jgi:glutamate N-acetyltransferase/amino-acid N-acetyltransferase|nr:bifunctional glutamate N-acetyltransferase/amino-acid acetyltransferase ArgJ [Clostridia bacterium]